MQPGNDPKLHMKEEAVNPITEGVIWKQLLLYFVPLLAASFLQLLYNTADTIIVGRFVGKIALTAVGGSAGQIYAMVTEFMIGVSGGAGVIMSQAYGARDRKLLDDGLHNAIALALLIGSLFTVVGLILAGPALRLAGAPPETLANSILYLRIVSAGLISNVLYNMGASILRAVGDSKKPLHFLLISSCMNILLDIIFVAILQWGIGGAAFATILSQTLSATLVLRTLIRGPGTVEESAVLVNGTEKADHAVEGVTLQDASDSLREALMPSLDLHSLRLQRDIVSKMLRLGVPLGFETLMYTFSCVVLTSAVNTFGTDTVAAYAGFVRIESFYWMLEAAFAVSITTFVGQNYGAGRMDRVHKVARQGALLMYLFMGTAIVIMYTGCPVWLGLFTTDAGVLAIGVAMMRYLLPYYILYVPSGVFFSTLRGLGDSLRPTIITFLCVCVLRIAWVAFVFPAYPTIEALLFCFPVSWTVTALTYPIYYTWYIKFRKA